MCDCLVNPGALSEIRLRGLVSTGRTRDAIRHAESAPPAPTIAVAPQWRVIELITTGRHWAPGRGGAPKTQDGQERGTRLHIVPYLGRLPLRSIVATDLRAFITKLESTVLSVGYQRGILSEPSSVLEAAVDDKRLVRTPMHAKSVRWPKSPRERRDAWSMATALRVRDAINEQNRIAVVVGLGRGLRQGEVFGLGPEDVDYVSGVLHVRRQVQAIHGRLYFVLPKGRSARWIWPPSVAEDQASHRSVPAGGCGAAVGEAGGGEEETWKPALAKTGVIPPPVEGAKAWQCAAAPKDGFHVLRHRYASIMLEAGESVVTLARSPGRSSSAITLGYYAHFMPEAGSKGRGTIDGRLGERGDRLASRNSPDSPQRR